MLFNIYRIELAVMWSFQICWITSCWHHYNLSFKYFFSPIRIDVYKNHVWLFCLTFLLCMGPWLWNSKFTLFWPKPIFASWKIEKHKFIVYLSQNVRPLHNHCCALSLQTSIATCTKTYFTRFLDAIFFLAVFFGLVSYMAVGMTQRGLVSFAMLLLNFFSKVDFIL